MLQIIQDLQSGQTLLEEIPTPQVREGCVLIQTTHSLVSLGTERMLVEFGRANLIEKARQQPERVKQVLDKIKADGLMPTLEAVFNKLSLPLPLGYCNAGRVIAVGKGVTSFQTGDRVASNGNHAEVVCVPQNLVAKIPDNVTDDEATFTVIGSIGLQGIRLLQPALGETVVVFGLGLIGLITAQLLKANGCCVIGVDFDQQKVDLAKSKGIIAFNSATDGDIVGFVLEQTSSAGCDGVIITASAKTNDIIHQSALMSRKRGRIVLVGVIGLDLRRDDFYKKELSFQVSCSYGPGRYEEDYENKGQDYPPGFVRWTEKRNFEAVLQAISTGMLDVKPLISEVVPLENYEQIYGDMKKKGVIASILKYPEEQKLRSKIKIESSKFNPSSAKVGIIGAGNFTSSTMLPALQKANAAIKYIASAQGLSAKILAKKANAEYAISDYNEILNDPEIGLVLITTRHNAHAKMVKDVLQAGKNVFVEKPLCLNETELNEIISIYKKHQNVTLTVGFNRRFSPFAVKMKQLSGNSQMNIIATMNAGFIPQDVWIQDMEIGGGRITGEACHYIDMCSFLAGSRVVSVCVNSMGVNPKENTDNVSILLKYENGCNAAINYFANGSKAYSKERFEIYSQERTLILDNWMELKGYGFKGFSKMRSRQDKGHNAQFALLNERLKTGGEALIPFDSIVNTTQASFACIESLKEKSWIDI
ncbi:MAG: bi-domain-containing oxidoreductase [Dysgonamonadaceae bacterium]|jgi:predicted dehydrogenase/threonine dehydrogenase-like Zn-dependent dehydrogenase|nr:bi-domain-containing oxidoreductase [Dysgonamonadaceae bacterium]